MSAADGAVNGGARRRSPRPDAMWVTAAIGPSHEELTTRMRARGSVMGEQGIATRVRRLGVVAWLTLAAGPAAAQGEGYDPAGSSPIVAAVHWLQGTLLGTVATVAAAIAVASVGFMMLTGRMSWRYGATVILGCFILFGAASIVAGIRSTVASGF